MKRGIFLNKKSGKEEKRRKKEGRKRGEAKKRFRNDKLSRKEANTIGTMNILFIEKREIFK